MVCTGPLPAEEPRRVAALFCLHLRKLRAQPLQTSAKCGSIHTVMNLNTPKRSDGESRFALHGKERSFTG